MVGGTVYEMEKLRCNLCGETFTAKPPEDIGEKKYDETATAIIALLKYGNGFPFYRLEQLQKNLGVPVPATTQRELKRGHWIGPGETFVPAHEIGE